MYMTDFRFGKVLPIYPRVDIPGKPQKYLLLLDSGPVTVAKQVWSNGGLKKDRGRAVPSSNSEGSESDNITMMLLLMLPVESTVSPLPQKTLGEGEETGARSEDDCWVFDLFLVLGLCMEGIP
ncbi:hypothetical protein MLD38_018874 [Melastoma candidum]|uniref:Uncharacterized protein n=1 Tax=Melastoma candidum TaxID=119954 RepID=A0ACB9QUL1_9MYRT|nr:hypothetical protein MLD38_018874 [Melastoma candidum]